jgi:hypothetical protein
LKPLSEFIILLLDEISKEGFGAQLVRNELQLTLESLFKYSGAFKAAFELYATRFDLRIADVSVDGNDLAEMLEKIKAGKGSNESDVLIRL